MNYIVFDLEFNQPLSKEQLVLEPFPFCCEVIQIGAVKMDEGYKIKETIDILVKPFYYKQIGNSVRNRIEMYRDRFQCSMTFPEAYKRFLDFCGDEYCLFTWGMSDITILNENALIHRLQPINSAMIYDVQKMYFEYVGGNKSQIGLQDAVKKMRLDQYVAHNAFNDAYSTAEILSKLGVKKGCVIKNMLKVTGGLYINEEYSSRHEAQRRAQESKFMCSCGAEITVNQLIALGKRKAITASQCICGKEYFIVAKFLKIKYENKINLQCYKWIMSDELKAFYIKQKSIDDAITEYAKTHSRKSKK